MKKTIFFLFLTGGGLDDNRKVSDTIEDQIEEIIKVGKIDDEKEEKRTDWFEHDKVHI